MAAKPHLPHVYLLRHGETAWTVTGQHTGRTDLPLNDQGERQARAVAARLAALPIDHVIASPLQRARRTAELAMPDARIALDDDLMEWDYGAYDGRTTVDIRAERPGWRLFRDGCPGGETIDGVGARADGVIGRVRERGGNVLLVAHREILRVVAVRWIGLAPKAGGGLMLATGSLSVLGYDHDIAEPAIHVWNDRGAAAAGAH
ncbi:MAG: histidine phosphatase family protein [Ardenticatenales bacterium]